MGSVHLIFLILMIEIFHILQEFMNRSGNQKGEKKVSTFRVPKKVSHIFLHLFFNGGINRQYPNDRLLVQNVHTMFRQREEEKKVTCNHRPKL